MKLRFLMWLLLAFSGCMLIRSLCDPEKLGKWGALSLTVIAWVTLISTSLIMIFAEQLSLIGSLVFHVIYGIMASIAIGNLIRCAIKCDTMAMLQLMGASGAGFIAICRIFTAMGWIDDLPVFDFAFYFAILAEVLATSVVVGYRALQMRRERDDAVRVKKGLEFIASTDDLTGLPNKLVSIAA